MCKFFDLFNDSTSANIETMVTKINIRHGKDLVYLDSNFRSLLVKACRKVMYHSPSRESKTCFQRNTSISQRMDFYKCLGELISKKCIDYDNHNTCIVGTRKWIDQKPIKGIAYSYHLLKKNDTYNYCSSMSRPLRILTSGGTSDPILPKDIYNQQILEKLVVQAIRESMPGLAESLITSAGKLIEQRTSSNHIDEHNPSKAKFT